MDRGDISTSEKFRLITEAYKTELEYGRTIETYRDTINIDGVDTSADFLRIGRIALTYLTTDGSKGGYYDLNQRTFLKSSGSIKRNSVDYLEYNVQGETGPGITYTSGLGCSDATMTLKSTTKIEPQATIDPDYDVPLVTPYVTCKYLIKAF